MLLFLNVRYFEKNPEKSKVRDVGTNARHGLKDS